MLRADHHPLPNLGAWRAAEATCAVVLAHAARAIGRLEAFWRRWKTGPRAGLIARLALREVEAMLWAAGTPIAQDVLIRDLADAPAATDLDAETPSDGLRRLAVTHKSCGELIHPQDLDLSVMRRS